MKKLAILVPVKPLAEGKSRLEGILGAAERVKLNRILALRTFEVARELLDVAEVFVVSKSAEVLKLARDHFLTGAEESPLALLNDAIAFGCSEAKRCGLRELLVLPVVLIFLTSARVRALLHNSQNVDVIIVPDAAGKGTNLIYWRSIESVSAHFGTSSAIHHERDAKAKGLSVEIVNDKDLSFDLDSPTDFQTWNHFRFCSSGTYQKSA
jgi:2-phospho-L-lactate/phosphoenolpyruvate guanylyltransferase